MMGRMYVCRLSCRPVLHLLSGLSKILPLQVRKVKFWGVIMPKFIDFLPVVMLAFHMHVESLQPPPLYREGGIQLPLFSHVI